MAQFPASPISPQEFMQEFLPAALSDSGLLAAAGEADVRLGVLLRGDGGGEWVLSRESGALCVEAAPRDDTAMTLVQSVDDWRGALWEGRGGVFGDGAVAIFRAEAGPSSGLAGGFGPDPAAFGSLAALDGLVRIVVTDGPGGDWCTAIKLGPGAIPAEPTTTITVSAEDAEAMRSGRLDVMQAFMSGRIEIAGDATLVLQMAAMQGSRGA